MLIDTHCHLASLKFASDVGDVVARAVDAGVERMIVVGTDLDDCPQVLALAEKYAAVHAAVGIHPCDVTDVQADDWLERVAEWSLHEKVVAIGETGLDFFHPPPDGWSVERYRERQEAFFSAQLALAAERGLPVVVHQRGEGCWQEATRVVRAAARPVRAQFHCFIGPWTDAAPLVAEGHRISFTGVVSYGNASDVAATAAAAEAGSFFLETDAPYLSPVPHRGKRCEPAFTRATAEFIAAKRGTTLAALAAETTAAARAFFPRLA